MSATLSLRFLASAILFCATSSLFGQAIGTLEIVAGNPDQTGHSGDGGPATSALLTGGAGIASDSLGNIYFNDSFWIRKVDGRTGIITNYAGVGTSITPATPFVDTPATLAAIFPAEYLAFDHNNVLYILDFRQVEAATPAVRKIDPATGIISLVKTLDSSMIHIDGFVASADGSSIYLSDFDTQTLYRLDVASGALSAIPGTTASFGSYTMGGDSEGDLFVVNVGATAINEIAATGGENVIVSGLPVGDSLNIASDYQGNVYLNETGEIVRFAAGTWQPTIIAGSGSATGIDNGDGGPATDASINAALIAVDPYGNVYYLDAVQRVIRRINVAAIPSANIPTFVSAASSQIGPVAAGSIVSVYGTGLAIGIQSAATIPLPNVLAGTTIKIADSNNVTSTAPLYFVSPDQINFLLPSNAATGVANVTITSGNGVISQGSMTIAAVSPGLFVVNAQDLLAANILNVASDGTQSYSDSFTVQNGNVVPAPISITASNSTYLIIYGTGISGRSSLENVTFTVGNVTLPALYAGPQSEAGLDQVNVLLPASLAGSGVVSVFLTVDGMISNHATITIQ